jgi:arsenite methyltransferase
VRRSLVEILVDPETGRPLGLLDEEAQDDEVLAGVLVAESGQRFPITGGIPRFVLTEDEGQRQTESSFGYKWTKLDSFGSASMQEELYAWLIRRYGFESDLDMRAFFSSKRRTLDAGCAEYIGVDISAAIDVARERLGGFPRTHFVQADVLELPFRSGTFDAIISEGVLHHTPSTERAMKSLVPLLTAGGELMFYVYRRKAPIREFTDDYVRDRITGMPPEEAWEALRPLTQLGQALAELDTEVEVPDVPLLGIKAGRYDVQRLIYWHVAKLFWNPNMTFEENNHLNFDWYAPRYAHRQTEEDVRCWCADEGLEIVHFDVHEAGYTVRAVKPG